MFIMSLSDLLLFFFKVIKNSKKRVVQHKEHTKGKTLKKKLKMINLVVVEFIFNNRSRLLAE